MPPSPSPPFWPAPEQTARIRDLLATLITDATAIVGIGEAAHFVAEFNELRVQIVHLLVELHGTSHIALEVGFDEATQIEAWFHHHNDRPLDDLVGPLTVALYGSFLTGLRDALGATAAQVSILGVDLPNSLTLEPSLAPLASLVQRLDPDAADFVEEIRRRSAAVTGASAAASAASWLELEGAEQDAITVALARLSARVEALEPLYTTRGSRSQWMEAVRLARSAVTTDLMLRAMGELFSGTGRAADTTLREHFIAGQLLSHVERLPAGTRIAYVAHNNHIQKTPVRFYGSLTALPAGLFLARALGDHYIALAFTHLGDKVPEMNVPAANPLGFDVVHLPVEPPGKGSVEVAALAHMDGEGIVALIPLDDGPGEAITTIRSQSAVSEAPFAGSFDAALVCPRASLDPAVKHLFASFTASP